MRVEEQELVCVSGFQVDFSLSMAQSRKGRLLSFMSSLENLMFLSTEFRCSKGASIPWVLILDPGVIPMSESMARWCSFEGVQCPVHFRTCTTLRQKLVHPKEKKDTQIQRMLFIQSSAVRFAQTFISGRPNNISANT